MLTKMMSRVTRDTFSIQLLGLLLQTFRHKVRRVLARDLAQRPREAREEQSVPPQVLHVRHVSQAVVDGRGAVCNRRESVHL